MAKEERMEYSIGVIERLIKDTNLDMSVDEFVKVYASNRGIEANPINVCRNIEKYQLTFEGNYKYLFNILGDRLNFLQENPKRKQYEYIAKFNRDNYKHYHIKVNLKDKDVIEKLDSVPSKNGYITDLIRKDIGKE